MPIAIYFLVVMWGVYGVEFLILGNLNHWGIYPRTFNGLVGIPFAPFIHSGLWHLIGNSIPFAILGTMIQLNPRNNIWDVIILGTVITGLGVWLFGGSSYHIGASGLVMVFWAYLIADGWFERSLKSMFLAVFTVVFYGWMIYVVFDLRAHISWSSHLLGALAGVVVAWLKSRNQKSEGRKL